MFARMATNGYVQALPGILMKTLVHGEKTLLAEFRLTAGAKVPAHSHPHEQTGYLVSGSLELTIGAEARLLVAGDAWCIPGGVEHQATARQDSVAVEAFSPVREDYLPRWRPE